MVLVACGPYTTSDSITFDPLVDLIEVINKDRPDVCILVRLSLPPIIYPVLNVCLVVWNR